jgi:hypothetical protein
MRERTELVFSVIKSLHNSGHKLCKKFTALLFMQYLHSILLSLQLNFKSTKHTPRLRLAISLQPMIRWERTKNQIK